MSTRQKETSTDGTCMKAVKKNSKNIAGELNSRFLSVKKGANQRNDIMQTKRKRGEKICIKSWKQKRK